MGGATDIATGTTDAEKERLVPPALLAAIYPRQSQSDEEDVAAGRSLSSENQIRRGEAYCQMHGLHPLLELSRASVDLDRSGGAKLKDRKRGVRSWQRRPGLMRLYEAAQHGRFRHLICYDLNRLGGNDVELHLIREAFEDCGVTIHIVEQGIRTDSDAGRTMYGIFTQFAHQRLKDISTTARGNARTRAQEGKHHGKPPAWIERLPSVATTPEELAVEVSARGPRGTAGWYRLHAVRAAVLREMVHYRLEGLSYSQIARRLNDPQQEGGARATPLGARWAVGTVYSSLTDDARLKMRGCSVYGHDLPPGDPKRIVTPGVFPPLFGAEDTPRLLDALDAVQTAYRDRSLDPRVRSGERCGRTPSAERAKYGGADTAPRRLFAKTEHLVSGLIYCHVCGNRLTSAAGRKPYRQYLCKTAPALAETLGLRHPMYQQRAIGPGGRPQFGMSIGAHRIETAVYHGLSLLALRLKEMDWKPAGAAARAARARARRGAAAPRRGVEEIARAIDALLELYLAGRLRQADYDRKYRALADEREAAEAWAAARTAEDAQEAALLRLRDTFDAAGVDPETGLPARPDNAALRLVLVQLAARVEAPVTVPGVRGRSDHRQDLDHVRLYLKEPLPDGTRAVLSGMYKHSYLGVRRVVLESDPPPPAAPLSPPAPASGERAGEDGGDAGV